MPFKTCDLLRLKISIYPPDSLELLWGNMLVLRQNSSFALNRAVNVSRFIQTAG